MTVTGESKNKVILFFFDCTSRTGMKETYEKNREKKRIHVPSIPGTSIPGTSSCKKDARRGSRTHDHKIKSLALYRLS